MMSSLCFWVLLACTISGVQSECRNVDWWDSFDEHDSLSKCDSNSMYIQGLYRNDQGSPDGIFLIEEAVCCSATSPFRYSERQVMYADWWYSFDQDNRWNKCPSGYFLQGLYRTGTNSRLWNIEEGRCTKPSTHPHHYGECYDHNVRYSFDSEGVSKCNDDFFLTGLYRGGCDQLFCIEKFSCCKMAPMIIPLDSLASAKTRVMDITMSTMALLAHYLGYAWCSGCRGPYVGEDFRRSGDAWEADLREPCSGHRWEDRLSMHYADWKLEMRDIQMGTPVITDLIPQSIDGGVVNNRSPSVTTDTLTRTKEVVRSVTHTTTSSWRAGIELGFQITYTPSMATGGVGGGASFSFNFETSSSTQDSTGNQQADSFSVSSTISLQPYTSANWTMLLFKTRKTVAYTTSVAIHFSVEFRGFLRWGGGYNGDTTNYHYRHRGSGDRPTFNYRFGSANVPFYQKLRAESDEIQRPWLWSDMKAKYSYAQTLINNLADENRYIFTLTGKFDDVNGNHAVIEWGNPTDYSVSGQRRRRSASRSELSESTDTGRIVATEMPGDPAPVFPEPPAISFPASEDVDAKLDRELVETEDV